MNFSPDCFNQSPQSIQNQYPSLKQDANTSQNWLLQAHLMNQNKPQPVTQTTNNFPNFASNFSENSTKKVCTTNFQPNLHENRFPSAQFSSQNQQNFADLFMKFQQNQQRNTANSQQQNPFYTQTSTEQNPFFNKQNQFTPQNPLQQMRQFQIKKETQNANNSQANMKQLMYLFQMKKQIEMMRETESQKQKAIIQQANFINQNIMNFYPNNQQMSQLSFNTPLPKIEDNTQQMAFNAFMKTEEGQEMKQQMMNPTSNPFFAQFYSELGQNQAKSEPTDAPESYEPLLSNMHKFNATDPYKIELHVQPKGIKQEGSSSIFTPPQKIKETRIGEEYQVVPPRVKNYSKRYKKRKVKIVWNPEYLEENQKMSEIMKDFSKSLTDNITNEEKAIKLLIRAGMDEKRVSLNLRKNRAVYKEYFGIDKIKNAATKKKNPPTTVTSATVTEESRYFNPLAAFPDLQRH